MTALARYRTMGGFTPSQNGSWQTIWDSCSNSSWTSGAPYPTLGYGKFLSMNDYVVPDFHARRERGEVFFNPMNSVFEERIVQNDSGAACVQTTPPLVCGGINRYFSWRAVSPNAWHKLCCEVFHGTTLANAWIAGQANSMPYFYGFGQSDLDSLIAEVCTDVLNKRGTASNNMWETVAEFKQSLALLGDTLMSVAKMLDAYVLRRRALEREIARRVRLKVNSPSAIRRNQLAIQRLTKEIANLWAQGRWAYKPLIESAITIIEGLKKGLGGKRVTTRGFITDSRATSTSRTHSSWTSASFTFRCDVNHSVSIRAMSLDEAVLTLMNNLGFDTKGLLKLPWNLLNLSFVVDMFTNVGSFIGSVLPSPGFTQLGSCYVIEENLSNSYSPTSTVGKTNYSVTSAFGGSFRQTMISKRRVNGPFAPKLILRADFRLDNLYRLMDLWSLTRQRISPYL